MSAREYAFELPPQTAPLTLTLRVGDYVKSIHVEPKLRPELVDSTAQIKLPGYLQRSGLIEQDVRGGKLSAVEGSTATVVANASRELAEATINGNPAPIEQTKFASEKLAIGDDEQALELWWQDHDGLAGREPFKLAVQPSRDESPTILSQDLPRQAVVLESEQLNFQALAADDFGIKQIGISWRGLDENSLSLPAKGEKLISIGGPMETSLQVPATFSAASLGIEAQPIEVRLWVEDYLPDRLRVYGPPHVLFVLTAEEHAVWITNQMSKWHRAALDVRDKELQLHEENKRLRSMDPSELSDRQMQDDLRRQAASESSNARRLGAIAKSGENLLRQAARNPEIGVGHLDQWAEMLQILNDIGTSRMPSVADLLDKASVQQKLASGASSKPGGPKAGQNRGNAAAAGDSKSDKPIKNAPTIPSISDMESSDQPQEGEFAGGSSKKKYSGKKLTLPKTTLAGPPQKSDGQPEDETEEEEEAVMDQAIQEQADLLAEFERISEELNTILANLEGSTLMKRLKAASREQNKIAEKIGSRIQDLFGAKAAAPVDAKIMLNDLAGIEQESSQKISFIMDDMQSYFERRRMNQFKIVLDEMKEFQVVSELRKLGEDIPKEQGISIAQAEYWSDTLDRWGDDLVDPACSGECPGCKTSDALPPSLILEVIKVLESEVNLREETRVAEQAKPGVAQELHFEEATRLSNTQSELKRRVNAVVDSIKGLPNGEQRFGKEISLLTNVSSVMNDAVEILRYSDTGSKAIAAETEAIELLLQCKRINPKGGGGGGDSPGGGGTGTTQDTALALLGSGLNQHERRETREVNQATGETGNKLPEEFRAGLDEYFRRWEESK